MNTNVTIREGSIAECISISKQIPEFVSNNYPEAIYLQRLSNKPHLILVAEKANQLVGFKIGYERDTDGSFYSWLGGILPDFRKMGVASLLANRQENWALAHGYRSIVLKTRNKFKNMLLFALKNGFSIENIEQKETVEQHRIILHKILISNNLS